MNIEQKVRQTLSKIGLNKKEKIVVALSGGKDSTVAAFLLKKGGYNIEGIHLQLGMSGYSDRCFDAVKKLCEQLDIKLHVYDIKKEMGSSMCYLRTAIQSSHGGGLKNCAICGVIKKWVLNKKARELGAKKIATGHNLDDEAQTFLMNVLKGSPELSASTGPVTQNKSDKKFIARIKPLYYVPEEEIRKYSKAKKLPVVYEKCPCAIDSYRLQVREFMKTLSNKEKANIIKNAESVITLLNKSKMKGEIKYCESCGEPSRNNICKMCQLMKLRG
jgi:uncharacterized protein (TIGR00269 family)